MRMVNTVRQNIPAGIPYEIVVCDGGSTDGTIEWCEKQPDIVLIRHGELKGAIKAFDDAANLAQGDLIILANDDVLFHKDSILPAVIHLEQNPQCGAVAFMDNRPAPGYADGYKIQNIAVDFNGERRMLPYAQVGMFRGWLGKLAGWWGSNDEIMGKQGHTYGGDSFLSSRLYEFGYTIDVVPECKVDDLVPPDELRQHNYETEQLNPGVYYKRYPKAPRFNQHPVSHDHHERLRILYLPLYEPPFGKYKSGLREALARVGLVYELDYINAKYDLSAIVRLFKPHLLLMQAHSASSLPLDRLVAARAENPGMVVANWNGDVYGKGLTDDGMLAYLRHVDLQLVVNDSVIDVYRARGIQAAYWQIGFESVDYDHLPTMPTHDVVFLANGYSDQRTVLGETLRSMTGVNVGLYGQGWKWGNGDTTYKFAHGASLYRNAKIAVGDNQYADQRGFVSNRLFEALASGAFLLHQTVPGLEDLTGLQAGVHYAEWSDVNDLQRQIRQWLDPKCESKRQAIAAAGRDYVRAHHSFDARVQQLFKLLGELERDPQST